MFRPSWVPAVFLGLVTCLSLGSCLIALWCDGPPSCALWPHGCTWQRLATIVGVSVGETIGARIRVYIGPCGNLLLWIFRLRQSMVERQARDRVAKARAWATALCIGIRRSTSAARNLQFRPSCLGHAGKMASLYAHILCAMVCATVCRQTLVPTPFVIYFGLASSVASRCCRRMGFLAVYIGGRPCLRMQQRPNDPIRNHVVGVANTPAMNTTHSPPVWPLYVVTQTWRPSVFYIWWWMHVAVVGGRVVVAHRAIMLP